MSTCAVCLVILEERPWCQFGMHWMGPTAAGNEWIIILWAPEFPVTIRYALDGPQLPPVTIWYAFVGPRVHGNN
jgi:hypothetical protein